MSSPLSSYPSYASPKTWRCYGAAPASPTCHVRYVLRASYAISGTAYTLAIPPPILLDTRYAMSGTDRRYCCAHEQEGEEVERSLLLNFFLDCREVSAYAALSLLEKAYGAMGCPVLRWYEMSGTEEAYGGMGCPVHRRR
eukprot:2043102-Rhodomonas_salina.2